MTFGDAAAADANSPTAGMAASMARASLGFDADMEIPPLGFPFPPVHDTHSL